LQAEDIVKRAAPNSELFATRQSEDEGLTRLIERLQARLGAGQVQRLGAVDDHRPERASRLQQAEAGARPAQRGARRAAPRGAGEANVLAASPRPVWIEPVCAPLAERRSRPLLDGQPLSLLSGPERIEAGWWDAGLAERDYFIAEAADGALVWIYRARLPLTADARESGWFLHGRFG
jgi:protein ImuB